MTTLTPEQRQEIQRAGEDPVRLSDPETQTNYVILKADVYERIRVASRCQPWRGCDPRKLENI
jgi:hypothetical protein